MTDIFVLIDTEFRVVRKGLIFRIEFARTKFRNVFDSDIFTRFITNTDAAATTGTTTFDAVDFKGVEEDILFEFISEEGMTVLDLGFFHPCYYKPNNPKRLVMMHFLLHIYREKQCLKYQKNH